VNDVPSSSVWVKMKFVIDLGNNLNPDFWLWVLKS
jgi:hypothetical protein